MPDQFDLDIHKILACFGWQYNQNFEKLECKFCGRNIEIKSKIIVRIQNFQSMTSDDIQSFNPSNSHRYFCKYGSVSLNGDKIYGWNICLSYLFDEKEKMSKGIKSFKEKRQEMSNFKMELQTTIEKLNFLKYSTIKRAEEISGSLKDIEGKYNITDIEDRILKRKKELEEYFNSTIRDLDETPNNEIKKVSLIKFSF